MWIDKDIIPALIDAVEITIRSGLEAFEGDDFNEEEHFDGNDLVILDSFVLHTLKENIGRGFYSSEMLYKGFGFMMGLVRWYLSDYGHTLPNICYGKLARLHYEYYLKEAISYLGYIEPENIRENAFMIDVYIEQATSRGKFSMDIPQKVRSSEGHETRNKRVVSLSLVSDNDGQAE